MMIGVKFGEAHSYDNFGLILISKTISEPEPQTNLVDVPGRNGSIDMTEAITGDVRYKDRAIVIGFAIKEHAVNIERKREELANYMHGEKLKIIFDDDPAYYWIGRLKLGDFDIKDNITQFVVSGTVHPYKYNVTVDDSDFLWDPFDFEKDSINNIKFDVNGEYNYQIQANGRAKNPIMTVEGSLTCQYDDETAFDLPIGTNVIYQIVMTEGVHNLKFVGNGSVSVDYVGGSL